MFSLLVYKWFWAKLYFLELLYKDGKYFKSSRLNLCCSYVQNILYKMSLMSIYLLLLVLLLSFFLCINVHKHMHLYTHIAFCTIIGHLYWNKTNLLTLRNVLIHNSRSTPARKHLMWGKSRYGAELHRCHSVLKQVHFSKIIPYSSSSPLPIVFPFHAYTICLDWDQKFLTLLLQFNLFVYLSFRYRPKRKRA